MAKGKSRWRCRSCGTEFTKNATPHKAVIVICPTCGSDDIEVVSL